MSLIDHAKREFKRCGYIPLDQEQEDGPNKWIQENLLELLDVFSKQGHSGFSASYCIDAFHKLASYKLLKPIASIDEFDFQEVSDDTEQSRTISSVFRDKKTGKAYYLDAIVWNNGTCCYGGSAEDISSSQYIKYPWMPKTFTIDVIEKDEGEFYIKNRSDLDKVWKIYERKDKC